VTVVAGTRRRGWRLAPPVVGWLLAVLVVVLLACYAVLAAAAHELTFSRFWVNVVVIVPVAAVGWLVAARQPGNPIGWIFLAESVLFSLGCVGGQYAVLAYRMGHHLPWGPAAVLLALYWSPVIVTFPAMILLFPDGRLPSRRWRRLLVAYLVVGAAWPVSIYAVAIGAIAGHDIHVIPGGDLQAVDNPSGGSAWLSTVDAVVLPVLAVFWALFVLRQVLAWRQADGERRQQLKWLMGGTAVTIVCTVLVAVVGTLDTRPGPVLTAVSGLAPVGVAALPVCMGVAILRYRLWEIDRIISRTLAYAIVTGLLVGVYAGLVLLATEVLKFHSTVAVAAATLAAAALFNPVRRRVQQVVDGRFNRTRYDADRMVAAFAARLKDAVDLDSIRDDLAGVVHQALEPAHVSVWVSRAD
jgi:hypothetical protein